MPDTWDAELDKRRLKVADIGKTKHVVDHHEPLATHWLGKGRKSGDDGGVSNAKRVDGQPLLDEDGKPIA